MPSPFATSCCHFVELKREKSGANRFLILGSHLTMRSSHCRMPASSSTLSPSACRSLMDLLLSKWASPGFAYLKNEHPRRSSQPSIPCATARSGHRHLWFVPISTFYVEQEEPTGKTPAHFHKGCLCDKHVWDETQW